MKKTIFTVIMAVALTACGGSDSEKKELPVDENHTIVSDKNITQESNTTSNRVGYLIDSPVVNMRYRCGETTSKTGEGGRFECKVLPVVFMVGNLEIGSIDIIPDDSKVYLQDLLGLDRNDIDNPELLKLASFIQSFDDDGDISKAITIIENILIKSPKSFTELSHEEINQLLEEQGITPVSLEDARIHLGGEPINIVLSTPTPTPTLVPTVIPTPTPTPTLVPTVIPTPTPTPTLVPTVIPTPTPTPVPTVIPTPMPTPTPVSTVILTPTPTPVPTVILTPTPVPTVILTPTPVPTVILTPTPTSVPTVIPTPTPTPTPDTAMIDALRTGNASNVSKVEIYKAIEDTYATQLSECVTTLNKIYPNGLKPKADVDISSLSKVSTKSFDWIPLMTAYNGGDSETYFHMKEFSNGTRVVIGSMPLFNEVDMKSNYNDGVDKSEVLNILKWLVGSKGSDTNGNFKSDKDFLNSNIKMMWNDATSGWFYGGGWNHLWDVNRWIGANFSGVSGVTLQADGLPQNWLRTKNNSLPTDSSYDIYMATTPNDTFVQTVLDHANSGEAKGFFIVVPPLNYYNAHNSITGTEAHWGTYNQKAYGDAPSIEAQCRSSLEGGLAQLVSDLKSENFHYTFPQLNGGRDQNDRWNIPLSNGKQVRDYTDTVDGQTLNNKLFKKLDTLITTTRAYDYKKTDIFADANKSNNRLQKLFLLLGDKYREDISYPMDKVDTDNTTFFKALYADNSISYFRKSNTCQPKMGTFLNHDYDANRYANNQTLNAKTTTNKSKSFQTTKFSEPTTMGVYAPPGKEIVIKRTDSEQGVKVWIAINFTRGGIGANNSMPFSEKNLYNRPQTVSSHWIEIDTGEEIHLSTPYGGPIYVWWSEQTSAVKPIISFDIENVLEHPVLYLDGSESEAQKAQEIANFSTALSQNNNFSWAEIKTPFAELHSLMGNMMSVINNGTYGGDVGRYVEYMNKYLILGNYHWAGFNGGGLDGLNPSVADFCTEHNLDCTNSVIHQKPRIQHMNSDAHSLCGNACAGNPIDFDHGIDPIAQLPNHEMGHNLQRARMTLPNGGEVSNLNSTFRTSRAYALDQGRDYYGGWDQIRVEFNTVFDKLKQYNTDGSIPQIQGPLNNEGWAGVAFHAQLMWSSSTDENSSWDFYTKMWLHERLYTDALSTQSKWEEERDKLGFSTYSWAEAKAISSIDYMTIVSSYITNRDYRDFFALWMMKVSDKAKTQITANAYATTQAKAYLYIHQGFAGWWEWYENGIIWPVHLPTHWIDMSDASNAVYQ